MWSHLIRVHVPFPIARYPTLLVQQVGSPVGPFCSLTVLIGLHLIPYHEFFASQVFGPSVWPIPSVKVLADLNEGLTSSSANQPLFYCFAKGTFGEFALGFSFKYLTLVF